MFLIPDPIARFFHRMASPPHFYAFTERLMPWLALIFLLLTATGLYGGLYLAPPDYQQGYSCAQRLDVIVYLCGHGGGGCNRTGLAY